MRDEDEELEVLRGEELGCFDGGGGEVCRDKEANPPDIGDLDAEGGRLFDDESGEGRVAICILGYRTERGGTDKLCLAVGVLRRTKGVCRLVLEERGGRFRTISSCFSAERAALDRKLRRLSPSRVATSKPTFHLPFSQRRDASF